MVNQIWPFFRKIGGKYAGALQEETIHRWESDGENRKTKAGHPLLVAEFVLLVVAEFLLSSRDDDTRSWDNFLVYFSHKCHANLRCWGYIFIGC